MTTDQHVTTTPSMTPPLVPPCPPFSWIAPTDAQVAALLADPLGDGPDVLADDCGHVAPYGLVTSTPCNLALCPDCHATHRCPPCDADARAAGED